MTAADRDTLAVSRLDYDILVKALQAHGPAIRSPLGVAVHRFLDATREYSAERDHRVAAQTLRDAADAITNGSDLKPGNVRGFLRDRADTTEGTHHD